MQVKVLYEEGEENMAKEVLDSLETIHRDRFFFSWMAYKETRNLRKQGWLRMEVDQTKQYGLKLTIISEADYEDYKQVCDAIVAVGYKATVVDNGNTVFQKDGEK